MNTNINLIAREKMQKSVNAFVSKIGRIRTGRANASFVDGLEVDYYGTKTPLSQIATVNVPDAKTISIVPWEKSFITVIEKAILESDLGINPTMSDGAIKIFMPPLSAERRKELLKLVKKESELAKASLRNIRKDLNRSIKDQQKSGEITDDEVRIKEKTIQNTIDDNVEKINKILIEKEKDLMTI